MDVKITKESIERSRKAAKAVKRNEAEELTLNIGALKKRSPITARRIARNLLVYYGVIAILAFGLAIPIASNSNDSDTPVSLIAVFALLVIIFMVISSFLLLISSAMRGLVGFRPGYGSEDNLRKFCADNNWDYLGDEPTRMLETKFEEASANIGARKRIFQAFQGKWMDYPLTSYLLRVNLPTQEKAGRYYMRVFRITFHPDVVFPHIFISNNRAEDNEYVSVVPRHFDESQKLSLESGFEERFIAYSHAGTKTDAVSFLAPNALQTILQTNRAYDLELVGNELYLYSAETKCSVNFFRDTLTILATFTRHINHRLASWKLELPNSTYPYLTSQAGYGSLILGRQRINNKYWEWAFGYSAAILGVWYGNELALSSKFILTVTLTFIMVIVIILSLRRDERQNNIRQAGRAVSKK